MLDIYEWQGVGGVSMGKSLGQWSAPVFWTYALEQVQNLKNYLNIWKNISSAWKFRDTNHSNVLRPGPGLLSPVLSSNLKGKRRSLNIVTKHVAIPTLVTRKEFIPASVMGIVAMQAPVRGIAAEPEDQSIPVSALPKDPPVVAVLEVEEQLPFTTTMVL